MSLIRPNRIGRRWIGQPLSTPRALFNNAENGVFWDFSDPRSLYTDASGTIPVSAPDTAIRLAADKSRTRSPITAYAGVQASTGLAPRYGRAPKSRRQKLLWSGDLSVSPWGGGAVIATRAAETLDGEPFWELSKVSGSANISRLQQGLVSVAGQSETVTLALLAGTVSQTDVGIGGVADGGGPIWGGAGVTMAVLGGPGSVASLSGLMRVTNLSATVPTLVRLTRPYVNAGVAVGLHIYPDLATNAVAGASVKVAKCQLESGPMATPYQKTTTAYDMTEAGVPSFGFARFDLVDDVLSAVMTLAQTGDVLLFGRGGSWIEPGRVFAAASNFQVGVTGTAITPGILRALGDLVGIVAIGRTLSADERNRALRYFQAAGAAGWLTLGPNLWSDSGHTVNTGAAWTNNGDGTFTASGGTGLLGFVPGSTIIGRQYLGKLEVVSRTSGGVYLPYDGNGANTIGIAAVGTFQHVFTAIGTVGPYIYSNGFTGTVRAVSYQLITPGA